MHDLKISPIISDLSRELKSIITSIQNNSDYRIGCCPILSKPTPIEVNNNIPIFKNMLLTPNTYTSFCGPDSNGQYPGNMTIIGRETMAHAKRKSIHQIKPPGFQSVKYPIVKGKYCYHRCHMIGHQFLGDIADDIRNIFTGTQYLNIYMMLPLERMVAHYIKTTNNHVAYGIYPVYICNNIIPTGIVMVGKSIEDNGIGIQFCVFCYNIQPGVAIEYCSGNSWLI